MKIVPLSIGDIRTDGRTDFCNYRVASLLKRAGKRGIFKFVNKWQLKFLLKVVEWQSYACRDQKKESGAGGIGLTWCETQKVPILYYNALSHKKMFDGISIDLILIP